MFLLLSGIFRYFGLSGVCKILETVLSKILTALTAIPELDTMDRTDRTDVNVKSRKRN